MYTNPYVPNYYNNTAQTFPLTQQAPHMEIQKVSGEESAYAFPMGPNSSAILLDVNNPLIWIVTTDASAFKTVTPFTITKYEPEKPVNTEDLKAELAQVNDRLAKLEERMRANESGNGSNWKNKSGNANNQSTPKYNQNGKGPSSGNGTVNAE